ncbi:(E3-independent) E2 ubiquitin-conjugating enzyme UBE2O [Patella vulgata]|uniref:(E3-independent) E2 ubiquitin-conjugating enzyme UBE2O n=1 Tax=Patella vulgata TaxID=6465 RepID=UPI0024A92B41|nr:(E3-independent) E2 ubiquitin-conjugating enzyme UBE2O [Patella vulgata]
MATCNLFDEDVVCQVSPDKGYVFGLIIENSEFLSSSEDEEDDTDMDDERVKRGSVRVAWHPDGKETVVEESKLILVDRSVMPGDVIRRITNGKDSQQGFVQDMDIICHVHILGTDKYIYNINSKDLIPIDEFDTNPGEVTLDSWIGGIENINRKITIRMPDGARCKISEDDLCEFDNMDDKRSRHSEFWNSSCYPQEKFKGCLGDLHDAEWLHSTMFNNPRNVDHKQHSPIQFVVESIETESVEVHWLCRGFSHVEDPQIKVEPPPNIVEGDKLKRLFQLDWFCHCSVQIGDRAYYVIKECDKIETTPPKESVVPDGLTKLGDQISETLKDKEHVENGENKTEGSLLDAVLNGVDGEDGGDDGDDEYEDIDEESDDSDASSVHSGSSHGSSAGRKKKKSRKKPTLQLKMMKKNKGRRPRMKFNLPERSLAVGEKVPVEICYTLSKANVMWQDGSEESNVLSADLYPIHHLDELEFFPGDFVVDAKDTQACSNYGVVSDCDHKARTCHIKWVKPYDVGKSKRPTVLTDVHEVSVYDIKDHPNYKFRPGHSVIRVGGFEDTEQKLEAVGQVYRLNSEGFLNIKWSNGNISECCPQELYIVSDDLSEFGDSDHSSSSDSESESGSSGSDASWETETEEEIDDEDVEKDESEKEKRACKLTESAKEELIMKISEAHHALTTQGEILTATTSAMLDLSHIYEIIIRFYKSCKGIDKILKTKYFEDEELVAWINDLRKIHREEKTKKITKHLNQLYNTWNHGLIERKLKESQSIESEMDLDDSILSPLSSPGDFMVNGDTAKSITDNPFSLEPKSDDCSSTSLPLLTAEDSSSQSNCDIDSMNRMCSSDSNSNNHACLSNGVSDSNSRDMDKAEPLAGATEKNGAICDNTNNTSTAAETNESLIELKIAQERKLSICLKINLRLNAIINSKVQSELNHHCIENLTMPFDSTNASNDVKNSSPEVVQESRENDDEDLVERMCQQHQAQDNKTEEELATSVSLDDCRIAIEELGSPLSLTGFQYYGDLPLGHHYYSNNHTPKNSRSFMVAVQKELKLLQTSLPAGIIVKGFEDRMDVYSVMVVGPSNTPYEDGLFVFDLQLSSDYPVSPPSFHYISYCTERLNPNLYEDGKVCISLLGTWSGKGNELWCSKSNLLQIFVSVQGLILVKEPYYNEAGYEKQKGSEQAHENSRMYNEMAILKLVQSMTAMATRPPKVFENEVRDHLLANGPRMIRRLRNWIDLSGYSISKPAIKYGESSTPCSKMNITTQTINGDTLDTAVSTQIVTNGTETETSDSHKVNDSTSVDPQSPKAICDNPNVSGDNSKINNSTPGETSDQSLQGAVCDAGVDQGAASKPDFPLFPVSKGFCISLSSNLEKFEMSLQMLQHK